MAQVSCYVPLAIVARHRFPRIRDRRGVLIALFAGVVDVIGVIGLSVGADRGFVSVTIAASAVFPLVAVVLAFAILRERLVPNQFVGIGLVIAGLLMLGLGT
ncbi:MAG: EamA family transporter [Actinomycetota bacterium]